MNKAAHTSPETHLDTPMSRRRFGRAAGLSAVGLALPACAPAGEAGAADGSATSMQTENPTAPTQTAESQSSMTPAAALEMLREGNARFVGGTPAQRDLSEQIEATASGQYPFAIILGCVDSRVPIEAVFDQGIGDVFAARVAGNVVGGDVLGSMEFACAVAGSKVVMVLGHTACGAVKGAISRAELGNLTGLVQKIEPAVAAVEGERDDSNSAYVDQVAETNVRMVLDEIRARSEVLAGMEQAGDIMIVGAMYDISTGGVRIL